MNVLRMSMYKWVREGIRTNISVRIRGTFIHIANCPVSTLLQHGSPFTGTIQKQSYIKDHKKKKKTNS